MLVLLFRLAVKKRSPRKNALLVPATSLMALACLATAWLSSLWWPPGRFCSVKAGIIDHFPGPPCADPVGKRGKLHLVKKLPINVSHFFIIGLFTGTSVELQPAVNTFASEQNVEGFFYDYVKCVLFFTYLYCIYFICSLFQAYFRHTGGGGQFAVRKMDLMP